MNKRIGIIDEKLKNSFLRYFYEKGVEIVQFEKLSDVTNCYVIALYDYNDVLPPQISGQILNLHPSLLPSFDGENSVSDAYISGVKVSGVTVQNLCTGKILAQYPILITLTTTFDEYCKEIDRACEKIYPAVADAVLNDRVFDFTDLLNSGCGGNCSGGCKKCSY